MGRPDALPRDETIEFVLSCQHDNGGFGAAPGHDAHLLYTVSAVQILAMVDALEVLEEKGMGGKNDGGKMGVGRCMFHRRSTTPLLTICFRNFCLWEKRSTNGKLGLQISHPSKTAKQAPSPATNGGKKTRASSTQP
jgi:hypothetical protein